MSDTTTAPAAAEQETLPALQIGEPPASPQPQAEQDPGKPEAAAPEIEGETQDNEQEEKADGRSRNKVPYKVRIAQITGQRKVAEARAEALAEELAEARKRLQEFERRRPEMSFDEQEDARFDAALDRRDAMRAERQIQQTEQQIFEARQQTFFTKVEDALESGRVPANFIEEFRNVDVTPVMADLIAESDRTVEVAHYLTRNRQVASELAQLTNPKSLARMSPQQAANQAARAAKILGAIEATLKPGVAKAATRAPAPGTTLNGGSPPPSKTLEEEDDMGAYVARRKEAWKKGDR